MGKKIKTFAKVLIILGMAAFAVLTIMSFLRYYDDRPYTVYADGYKEHGSNPYISDSLVQRGYKAYSELSETIYYACGMVACLFAGLPLYWFGCLFTLNELMSDKITRISAKIESLESQK